jgi:hypothetical protein
MDYNLKNTIVLSRGGCLSGGTLEHRPDVLRYWMAYACATTELEVGDIPVFLQHGGSGEDFERMIVDQSTRCTKKAKSSPASFRSRCIPS